MTGSLKATSDPSFSLPVATSSETANDTAKLNLELFEKLLPSTVFFTVLICLGIPGNLLVFLVYLKKFKVSSTRIFVLAMAVCDIFICLFAAPVNLIYFRFMYTAIDANFCVAHNFLVKFSIAVSCFILICASLDRRHRVCQPLKRQLSARQATYVLVVPLGLASLATVPFAPFRGEIKHVTSAGVHLKKCGFQSESEFWRATLEPLEGSVLCAYIIVVLILLVWAYSHILYRIKSQNKRKRHNSPHDTTPADTVCALSDPDTSMVLAGEPETLQDTPDNTAEDRYESRDSESRDERLDGSDSHQQAQRLKAHIRKAIKEERQMRGKRQGYKTSLASKTTLVLFVLTATNAVCLLPYFAWIKFHERLYEHQLSSRILNLLITSKYLPSVRSAITPLIYITLNPRFRQQCHQFLAAVVNFHR